MNALIPTLAATVALTVTAAGSPVEAGAGAEVTHGRFETTAAGQDRHLDIRGHAVMIRTDARGGRTVVVSVARGLAPNTTYGSHVHDAPCSTGGGGHYQHDGNGPVDDENEIWPTLHTNRRGVAMAKATHDHRARPAAQSIVIHDGDGTRIACLDFS